MSRDLFESNFLRRIFVKIIKRKFYEVVIYFIIENEYQYELSDVNTENMRMSFEIMRRSNLILGLFKERCM